MGENISGKTQEIPTTTFIEGGAEHGAVYRSAWGLWSLTFASRVFGVVRDALMARFVFGWLFDGFVLGVTFQNVFRRFLGEGTLAPVLVPRVVERLKAANRVGANRLIRSVFTRVWLYVAALSVLLSVLLVAASTFAAGETAGKFRFMALLFPYGPLIAGAAALAAALNAYGYFAVPATGPVLYNLVLIGAVVLYAFSGAAWVLALGAAAGGAVSLLVMLPAAEREGINLAPAYRDDTGSAGEVMLNLLPVALSVAVLQVNVLFDRIAADVFIRRDGAVSVLYLSHRLIHLPLALFGINLATVFLPGLAETAIRNGERAAFRMLLAGVRMVLFLSLPAAMGLMVVAEPAAVFLFFGGRFAMDEQALERLVYAVVMYSPGVVFYSLATLVSRMYHARKDVRTPARYAAVAAGVNIVLDVALVIGFERWLGRGEAGLALASSISGLVYAALLLFGLSAPRSIPGALRALVASGAAGALAFALMRFRAVPALLSLLRISDAGDALADALAAAGALAAAVLALMLLAERRLRAGAERRTWEASLRISLAAWPTAFFAMLVARSIPPDRLNLLIAAERAAAPVLLGVFAYWLLLGFTGVTEYDELTRALRRSPDGKE